MPRRSPRMGSAFLLEASSFCSFAAFDLVAVILLFGAIPTDRAGGEPPRSGRLTLDRRRCFTHSPLLPS